MLLNYVLHGHIDGRCRLFLVDVPPCTRARYIFYVRTLHAGEILAQCWCKGITDNTSFERRDMSCNQCLLLKHPSLRTAIIRTYSLCIVHLSSGQQTGVHCVVGLEGKIE